MTRIRELKQVKGLTDDGGAEFVSRYLPAGSI